MNKTYTIIPRNLLLIFNGSKILLQKGRNGKKHWSDMYNGLGGHIEKGESIYKSAVRELAEEGGIAFPIDKVHLKGVITVKTYFNEDCFMFVFTVKTKKTNFKPNEEGLLFWKDINELKNIPNIAPDMKILVPLVRNLQNGKLITGNSEYNLNRKLIKFNYQIVNS